VLCPALVAEISAYLASVSENSRVYIGCDSSRRKNRHGDWTASYSTAIVVHNIDENGIGRGCKVFCDTEVMEDYDQRADRPAMRMMNEAFKSVEAYQQLEDELILREVEVHLDVNQNPIHGSNCAMANAVGYVRGVTGVEVRCKPEAFAASYAADHGVRGRYRRAA
jgi:uncharacterized protein